MGRVECQYLGGEGGVSGEDGGSVRRDVPHKWCVGNPIA